MRKILLTSAGMQVKDEIVKILPRPASELTIAHIITAGNKAHHTEYLLTERRQMEGLGFQVEVIELEHTQYEVLKEKLDKVDIIYVTGGNVFWLLKYVRESGFDAMVSDLLDKGKIYIGASAGSYICCPTIEMAFWKREPEELFGLTDFQGLNLVPFLLTVHYGPEYHDIVKEKITQTKYPVKILTDDQALLIEGDSVKLVGANNEITL